MVTGVFAMTAMTALRQQLFCCHSCPTDSNSDSTPTALRQCPTAMTAPTARAQENVLLKAVRALPDADGEVMSPESHTAVGRSDIVPMACAFTHDIFEMIAMIVDVRTACWSSDQAAACKLETPTSRHWHGNRSLRSSKRGGRGSFTMLPRHYRAGI